MVVLSDYNITIVRIICNLMKKNIPIGYFCPNDILYVRRRCILISNSHHVFVCRFHCSCMFEISVSIVSFYLFSLRSPDRDNLQSKGHQQKSQFYKLSVINTPMKCLL